MTFTRNGPAHDNPVEPMVESRHTFVDIDRCNRLKKIVVHADLTCIVNWTDR